MLLKFRREDALRYLEARGMLPYIGLRMQRYPVLRHRQIRAKLGEPFSWVPDTHWMRGPIWG